MENRDWPLRLVSVLFLLAVLSAYALSGIID